MAGFAAASTSTVLFAADHSTAIDAAYLDGNTNVTTAVVGLIGLMAVIVGVGAIIGLFRKG
ncbi:MAG: hypothetical protein GY941_08765 [Planctomycetes bacterium]|nr:hypothetical protein [Planctomycetota bacterium]